MATRVYLDNCCLNRPFDDQGQVRIRLEAEAKIHIQAAILAGDVELAWSYMLDLETSANPFGERRRGIIGWKARAVVDIEETANILRRATRLAQLGLRSKDAIHIACALAAGCDCFITTDDLILKRGAGVRGIRILDPIEFVREGRDDYRN